MDRERKLVQSLLADNDMLKHQLQRERNKYAGLEMVRDKLEKAREDQSRQISELHDLCFQEKSQNDSLLAEI